MTHFVIEYPPRDLADSSATQRLTGRGVEVAVIDSGWDRSVEDTRVTAGVGLVEPENELRLGWSSDDHDRIGHGTLCADLILQRAPDCRIRPVRIFGNRLECSPNMLIEALWWVVEAGIKLVNLSVSSARQDIVHPLYAACEHARRHNVIVVAASANRRTRSGSFPADFASVISAGRGQVAAASDISYIPGAVVECRGRPQQQGRGLRGELVWGRGASVVAPLVTGMVACLLEERPDRSIDDVRRELQTRLSTR